MSDARFMYYKNIVTIFILLSTPILIGLGVFFFLEEANELLRLKNGDLDYSIGLLWALLILILIAFCPITNRERNALLLLWIVRIGVTMGFMLLFESYYPGDAWFFFAEGIKETEPMVRFGFGKGTENMIGFVALHQWIVPESYHAIKVTCSLIGLIAVYFFYQSANLFFGYRDIRILYLLGLFPSILFWGSIFGKDPIVFFGIALYTYGVVGFFSNRKAKYLFLIVLGVLLATFIRIWFALILLLPLSIFFIGQGSIMRRILLFSLGIPALLFAMQGFNEKFKVETAQDVVERADKYSQSWARGGSAQKVEGGFNSISSMLVFLPAGIFTALFRPLPGEVLNPFGLLASAENAILIGMLLLIIFKGRWRQRISEPIVAWAIALVIVWAAMYGFVSYQNLGTAVRFKLQVMPILLLIIMYLASQRRGRTY
ncbi:MAG: hypothetical protein P9E88_09955 [Candidatus Competibacter sp.]|nr:hypothetical protein [Candidatus Competibacter sp.]